MKLGCEVKFRLRHRNRSCLSESGERDALAARCFRRLGNFVSRLRFSRDRVRGCLPGRPARTTLILGQYDREGKFVLNVQARSSRRSLKQFAT